MTTFFRRNGPWIGLLLLVLMVTVLTSYLVDSPFLSSRNLTNLFRQAAINGVLATGMTFVILTGGIDLSIGSLVALTGVFVALSQVRLGWDQSGAMGAWASSLAGVGSGLVFGFLTGGMIAWLRIPPFVITLGMMVIYRGVALILTDGSGIQPVSESLRVLSEGYIEGWACLLLLAGLAVGLILRYRKNWVDGVMPLLVFSGFAYAVYDYKGFPVPVLVLFLILLIGLFVLEGTVLGRSIYAIGSNDQAAYYAGVPVAKVKWLTYAIMGLMAGLGGLLLTTRLNSAVPTAGQLFELDAIASVVIGGTSLKGGTGSVIGSFVGALTIAALNNGMDMLGVPSFYQMVFKGVIIIAAVGLDRGQRSRI